MNKKTKWIVITTVNRPTQAIEVISKLCKEEEWNAVVVGDLKTPNDWDYENITYLSVNDQLKCENIFAALLPYNHYCRKNIGYLYAIKNGARVILETDDDNIPSNSFGKNINCSIKGPIIKDEGWVNIYKNYCNELIWPRGLPLDAIHNEGKPENQESLTECLIQQYLADEDPDVDAIFRLLYRNSIIFNRLPSPIKIGKGTWIPFNSQNTLFFKEAFSLMYLPSFVSFRMTDIWRSFVAQAALKAHNQVFCFHNATVKQIRNEHNLMRDFSDEIIGYQENSNIKKILEKEIEMTDNKSLDNISKTAKNMWLRLVENDIIPTKEVDLIDEWFKIFNV